MRSGQYLYSHTDLSIGDADGMKLDRMFSPVAHGAYLHYREFGSLSHNWDVWVDEDRIQTCTANDPDQDDYQASIHIGSRTQTFRTFGYDPDPDGFVRLSGGPYSRLEFTYTLDGNGYKVPSQYIFYDNDGTKVTFNVLTGTIGNRRARVGSLVEPDGTTYTFSYNPQLRTVVSNRGYALLFDYSAVGTNGESVIAKACVLNLAITPLPAMTSGAMCPAGARSSTYSYTSGEISSFTDQGGVSALLGANASKIYRPGETSPFLTNTLVAGYGTRYVTAQSFADGRSYSYSWNLTSNIGNRQIMGGTVTDNLSKTFSVIYKDYRPSTYDATYQVTAGPEEIIDQLGRKKTYSYCTSTTYCTPNRMLSASDPELNKRQYVYDARDNVTQITRVAKPGTSLANIVEGRGYTCGTDVCAAKPTTLTDGRGNVTNFTYDTVHGGLLSEMGAAPSTGAARPLKLVTWTQKYAYVKNSSGVLVQAATPVWVMATETQCQTAAGSSTAVCDTSAPKSITTYQYGPSGTANNLLSRGAKVEAGGVSRLTCWSHDNVGNRISETAPRAGLTTCP